MHDLPDTGPAARRANEVWIENGLAFNTISLTDLPHEARALREALDALRHCGIADDPAETLSIMLDHRLRLMTLAMDRGRAAHSDATGPSADSQPQTEGVNSERPLAKGAVRIGGGRFAIEFDLDDAALQALALTEAMDAMHKVGVRDEYIGFVSIVLAGHVRALAEAGKIDHKLSGE